MTPDPTAADAPSPRDAGAPTGAGVPFIVPHTLGELCDAIASNPDIPPPRRGAIVRDIRSFMRAAPVAGLRPIHAVLGPHLDRLGASGGAFGQKRAANIRSNVRAGLDLLYKTGRGLKVRMQPLSPEWAALLDLLPPGGRGRMRLSRFLRWGSTIGLDPNAVDDSTVVRFGEYVGQVIASGSVRARQHEVVYGWNAIAGTAPGWPAAKLRMPPVSRPGVQRGAFAPSFLADIDRYVAVATGRRGPAEKKRRFDEKVAPTKMPTIRERTAVARALLLRRAAALRAEARGVDLRQVKSLAELVSPGSAEEILEHYYEVLGREAPALRNLASALRDMVNRFMPGDVDAQQRTRNLVNQTKAPELAMTQKNRDLLRRLTPEDVAELHMLPNKLLDGVWQRVLQRKASRPREEVTLSPRDIVDAQVAVAVAILLYAPVRIGNLVAIRIATHFLELGESDGAARIRFKGEETKTGRPLDLPLAAKGARVVHRYVRDILPLIKGRADPMALFPGQVNGNRQPGGFGAQISRRLQKVLRLRLNPHFFRHFAAHCYLVRHPGRYDEIRELLGHADEATTKAFYCGEEAEAALKHVAECLIGISDEAEEILGARRRGRRRGPRPG